MSSGNFINEIQPSVIYREGRLTYEDYKEAIEDLLVAQTQLIPDGRGCVVCEDSGHQAMECHHNPLVMARRVIQSRFEYRCFHCEEVFNLEDAQKHFGPDSQNEAKCLTPGSTILRRVLFAARDFMENLQADAEGVPQDELNALNEALDAAIGEI